MERSLAAQLACVLEATARKAGNVHPFKSFDDSDYVDFLVSGISFGSILVSAENFPLGNLILQCTRTSQKVSATNTHLGVILLLAPLSKPDSLTPANISKLLNQTTVEDCELVYQAIRESSVGGLGETSEQDVRDRPTVNLKQAMELAKDRDLIARQYSNNFLDVHSQFVPVLVDALQNGESWEDAICWLQLSILSHFGDSLIERKLGKSASDETRRQAQRTLESLSHPISGIADHPAYRSFDRWLRQLGNKYNPGASADLVTATIFWVLRTDLFRFNDRPIFPKSLGKRIDGEPREATSSA